MRSLYRKEKRELTVLANDFSLLERKDVQEIIKTCKSYVEGQREIMRIYTAVYMG
jgi:predicted CopG family antitoxin